MLPSVVGSSILSLACAVSSHAPSSSRLADLDARIAASERRLELLDADVAASEQRAELARQHAELQACMASNAELQARALGIQAGCLEEFATYNGCEAKRSEARADGTIFGCLAGFGLALGTGGLGLPLAVGGCYAGGAVSSGKQCPQPRCEIDQQRIEQRVLTERRLTELPMCGGYAGLAVKDFEVTERAGMRIAKVGSGTTAASVGLARGDIVLALDSRAIKDASDVAAAMQGARPGGTMRVTAIRHKHQNRFNAEVRDIAVDGRRANGRSEFGAAFEPGTATARYFDAVEVIRVEGPAERAGIRVGDVIKGVNGTLVHRRLELRQVLGEVLPATTVVFHVRRGAQMEKIGVDLEPRAGRNGI